MTTKLAHPDCIVTFSSPIGEKNVTTSQNIEVADAKGSHPQTFLKNHKFDKNLPGSG